jgi:HEAT repeat protein
VAALALAFIGPKAKSAIPVLLQETGNADERMRDLAYNGLAELHASPEVVVPVLMRRLQDSDVLVQIRATWGLRNFGPDATSAAPVLLERIRKATSGATQYPASDVRKSAIAALKKIDPEAAAKLAAELNETW